MAVRVNAENFEAEVLNAEKPVLVDFYSDSCVPCKRLSPVLAEIEEEYSDVAKVTKLNINFDSDIAESYGIYAVPTIMFFKNGEQQEILRGSIKKSEIVDVIEKLRKH